jgi:hypothetical protein
VLACVRIRIRGTRDLYSQGVPARGGLSDVTGLTASPDVEEPLPTGERLLCIKGPGRSHSTSGLLRLGRRNRDRPRPTETHPDNELRIELPIAHHPKVKSDEDHDHDDPTLPPLPVPPGVRSDLRVLLVGLPRCRRRPGPRPGPARRGATRARRPVPRSRRSASPAERRGLRRGQVSSGKRRRASCVACATIRPRLSQSTQVSSTTPSATRFPVNLRPSQPRLGRART